MTKILIVEDDKALQDALKSTFEHHGFVVDVAKDGQEGFEKMRTFLPNIVLLDILLPKIDGTELLMKIKADLLLKATPVIMLTNLSEEEKGEASLLKGAVCYFVKANTDLETVVHKVKEILGTSQKPLDPRQSQ